MDLMDNGEIIMRAALERRETRAMHIRSDYTFTNPLLNDKFLTIRKENGKPVTEWRQRWEA
jgi:succinate dehydrogenase/fumarate reductase flavoprotein subunit